MFFVLNECVGGVGRMDSTSFPSKLVNKSCIGFVYQFHLMSEDSLDSVFVCVCLGL